MNETHPAPAPSILQRWVGFVPIVMTFAIMGWVVPRGRIMLEFFRSLRVELPLPTVLALKWCETGSAVYMIWLPAMLAISWIYFAWGTKTRDRLQVVNILATCVCLLTALILIAGYFLPFIKIQEALLSK